MYKNLRNIMKFKNVTAKQIASLLDCRQSTISDKLNGNVDCGFYFDEACKIKSVFSQSMIMIFFFPENKMRMQ